jgi:hypothetical protein
MKYVIATLIACALSFSAIAQNISISNAGSAPDASAMLDVISDSKGMLIPRMTTAQRLVIANPANGLLVFDISTRSFWYRQSTRWIELTNNYHGLQDADHDTKVQVEESPDEDIIRFDIGGEEAMVLTESLQDATRLELGTDNSIMIGRNVGGNSFPGWNTFIGNGAGQLNHDGEYNVFLGYQAGQKNLNTDQNTFIGYEAGRENIAGANTYVGYNAGTNSTTGDLNVFLGNQAGNKNSVGNRNTFLGNLAGFNSVASENTFVGNLSGFGNSTGTMNTFLGMNAGRANRTGQHNIAVGHSAGGSDQANRNMGNGNILMGYEADLNINGGSDNFIAGWRAGYSLTSGSHNIYIGQEAGYQAGSGAGNIGIGADALRGTYNGHHNVAVGDSALMMNINSLNVAVGSKAGRVASGYFNTFIGGSAGLGVTTGLNNVFVGANTGPTYNADAVTLIGANAAIQDPIENIFGSTAIGQSATIKRSNTVIIGHPSVEIGMGTSLPDAKLHVNSGAIQDPLTISVNNAPKLTVSDKGDVHVTDSLTIDGRMRIGSIAAGTRRLAVDGDVYFDDDLLVGDNVVIGISEGATNHRLTVDGKIACEEIRVQDSDDWPDYVFEETYPLQSLKEVQAYIQREKHLPGIPSAAEISESGILIGDMQKKLLEKVEELTLHIIRLEAEIEKLKK